METQLNKYFLVTCFLFFNISLEVCAQNKIYAPDTVVNNLINKKINTKNRVIKYDETIAKDFNVNGIPLYSSLTLIQNKLGEGEALKKKFIDNSIDIEKPIIYYKSYNKINKSLFQLNEKNQLIGFEILDSNFVLSFKNIKIGNSLDDILNKLPQSKNEISNNSKSYILLLKLKGVIKGCEKCSSNMVLYIDVNTKKLEKIFLEITDEIKY